MTHDSTTPTHGFSIIPNWMIADPTVTHHMLLVYAALASYADRDGSCWPSLPKLAERARVSVRTAQTALGGLERLGVLRIQRRRTGQVNLSNVYRVGIHQVVQGVHQVVQETHQGGAPLADKQDPLNKQPPLSPPGGTPALDGLQEPPVADGDHFSAFWAAYPRKVGKPQAQRAWTKALKAGTHWSVIVGGALAYAEDKNRDAAFTAHPSTWLNREGWNDDALPDRPPAAGLPVYAPPLPTGTMSERVIDCAQVGRQHRPMPDGSCMLCEVRATG